MKFRIKLPWVKFKFPQINIGGTNRRSRNNFKIGPSASMPNEIIEGFAYLKKSSSIH
jgi:fumarate hydratase class II